MGNVQSLSPQTVLGGIVIIGGVVYYASTYAQSSITHLHHANQSTSSNANKKGKKKSTKKSPPVEQKTDIFTPLPKGKASVTPIDVGFPTVLPGQFDAESVASEELPSQSKKPKK